LDTKYIAEGDGIAYRGALLALDAFAVEHGFNRQKLTSIEAYHKLVHEMTYKTKALRLLIVIYQTLHLFFPLTSSME